MKAMQPGPRSQIIPSHPQAIVSNDLRDAGSGMEARKLLAWGMGRGLARLYIRGLCLSKISGFRY